MSTDKSYGVHMVIHTPCGVINCNCERGTRYIACSYRMNKAEILKLEPGLEIATVETKVNGVTVNRRRFRRLHAGINGRKKDGWTNWINVT